MLRTLRSSRALSGRHRLARALGTRAVIEQLEPRQLLSVVGLGAHPLGIHGDAEGEIHAKLFFHGKPTPIADLTLTSTTLSAVSGVAVKGSVATLTSSVDHVNLRGYTATIDWGDGSAASNGKFFVSEDGTIHIKGSHTYAATGTFTVTVTLTQTLPAVQTPPTLTVTDTATVTQNSAGGMTITATHGTAFTGVLGTFLLPTGDTNTDVTSFLVKIDWGDGSTSMGTVTMGAGGVFSVSGTHTYAAAGSFRISVSVVQKTPDSDEDDGGSDPDANGDLHSNNHNGQGEDAHHDDEHDDVLFIGKIYSTATVA